MKYIVISEYVRSQNDNNIHFIGAKDVAKLYGINKNRAVLCYNDVDFEVAMKRYCGFIAGILQPKNNGRYDVFECQIGVVEHKINNLENHINNLKDKINTKDSIIDSYKNMKFWDRLKFLISGGK